MGLGSGSISVIDRSGQAQMWPVPMHVLNHQAMGNSRNEITWRGRDPVQPVRLTNMAQIRGGLRKQASSKNIGERA